MSNSVHQIYLNIESGYTNNLFLIEKFNLVNLYQKYSNQIFRYIVDEYLISNCLEPFYSDYPELTSNIKTDKSLIELSNKIRWDYHELINVPIKVTSCGSLLPEDWVGKIFDGGKSFHQSIDKLDDRIGKPPVTYLANFTMTKLKVNKPDLIEFNQIKKMYGLCTKIIILDESKLKFNQINWDESNFEFKKKKIFYNSNRIRS